MNLELAGWISSFLLGACALPQVLKTWRTGNTEGLSMAFLGMWMGGELFGLLYTAGFATIPWPLVVNYGANIMMIGYLIWKKTQKKK